MSAVSHEIMQNCILFPVGNSNVEMLYSRNIVYGGGGGRVGSGRDGSGQAICRQSRVGSGQRFARVGSGRVQESDPWTTLV